MGNKKAQTLPAYNAPAEPVVVAEPAETQQYIVLRPILHPTKAKPKNIFTTGDPLLLTREQAEGLLAVQAIKLDVAPVSRVSPVDLSEEPKPRLVEEPEAGKTAEQMELDAKAAAEMAEREAKRQLQDGK